LLQSRIKELNINIFKLQVYINRTVQSYSTSRKLGKTSALPILFNEHAAAPMLILYQLSPVMATLSTAGHDDHPTIYDYNLNSMIRKLVGLVRAGRTMPAAKVDLEGRTQRGRSIGQTANSCAEGRKQVSNRSDVVDKCSTYTWLRLADCHERTRYKGAQRQSTSPLLLAACLGSGHFSLDTDISPSQTIPLHFLHGLRHFPLPPPPSANVGHCA